MREIKITLYNADELSEDAQKRAHEEWLEHGGASDFWLGEAKDSYRAVVKACDERTIEDLDAGTCPLTGYYLDCSGILAAQESLKESPGFYEQAKEAGRAAVVAGWRIDKEAAETREGWIEHANANGYEYLADGGIV